MLAGFSTEVGSVKRLGFGFRKHVAEAPKRPTSVPRGICDGHGHDSVYSVSPTLVIYSTWPRSFAVALIIDATFIARRYYETTKRE